MHEQFIKKSIELAQQAQKNGDEPFGACLVKDGQIILTAENTIFTEDDPTGHAETNLVRKAAQTLPPETIKQSVLYSSTEPCPMCAGAIYWAEIRTVVFGCSHQSLLQITNSGLALSCKEVFG